MNQNPNWWRTAFASILLAIVLKAGFEIPLFTSLIAIGTIYLMHVVRTEMETATTTLWGWIKATKGVAMGLVIFIALRLVAGWLLNLYPTDTYHSVMGVHGRLKGIVFGHGTPERLVWVLMFELIFSLVAGSLSASWVQGKRRGLVGGIFTVSLIILGFQLGAPDYAKFWADSNTVKSNLAHHGMWGALKRGVSGFWLAEDATPPPATNPPPARVAAGNPTAPVPVMRLWTFRTLAIPPEGLPVYLYQGWKDWPKGGPITITAPGGEVLHDEPGVTHHFEFQPDGIYIFRADPAGSKREVQILNRW